MSNKTFVGLLALLILPAFSFAQSEGVCGTGLSEESAMAMSRRALANRQIMDSGIATERDDEVVYIPIKYHLFGKSNGTLAPKASSILGLHCRLNEEYSAHDIQFYINDGFEYYFNDIYYDNPGEYPTYLNSNRSNNSVNVWIGKEAETGGGQEGGIVLGYYSPGADWIVLRKDQANYFSETFAHEIGHFLSLNHPFFGWECTTWEFWQEDNPSAECAPTTSPCWPFQPTERVDGSNSAVAGDFLDDTPANYSLGFGASGCFYNGDACDVTGAQLVPDPTNIMGYFSGCDDMDFTPDQVEMALTDYNSNARNYLRTDGGPTTIAEITATTELVSPANAEVLSTQNVLLDWADTPNAEKYIVQTAINAGFTLLAEERLVDAGTSFTVDYLNPGGTYYWRVAPFNEYQACVNWSETRIFTAGFLSGVETVAGVTEFLVNPNPVSAGAELTFSVETEKSFSADFELISLDGKSVYSRNNIDFTQGNSSISVNTKNLSAGLYFATIRSANGLVNKRVVITK